MLSNKVIEYFGKCFSYAVAQNAGVVDGLQQAIALITPHAFGNHENCKEWCGYKNNPENYKHKDLAYGKDLFGENLKKALEGVFFYLFQSKCCEKDCTKCIFSKK